MVERYVEARLDPQNLGIEPEYHQENAGTWHAVVPLDDWLLVLQLALTPEAENQLHSKRGDRQ